MIVDVNAYLGPFAFRRLRDNTPETLLRLMDAKGIDRAWVSSAAAITYRDAHSGNEELAESIARHRDRLIPFAVLNPTYAGVRHDLKVCAEEFGVKGLRLYPGWHGYGLNDSACLDLIREATERGLMISIPARVEDYRQRNPLVDVPDVPLGEIARLVAACPKSRFLILNGLGFVSSTLGSAGNGLPSNYAIEISRLDPSLSNEPARLIETLGAGRLAFGTGMPFSSPDHALLKLKMLDASKAVLDRIQGGNAAAWLAGGGMGS